MCNTIEPKKAVCSFLGQTDVYDKDLKPRLIRELFTLAQQYDAIEFLFNREGNFENLCFLAAMTTKQHFPEKDITLTLVMSNKHRAYFFSQIVQGVGNFLHYFADRILTPELSYTDKFLADGKRVFRWVLQQSTHLIRYLYREVDQFAPKGYPPAEALQCTILDVSSEETSAFLADRVRFLPEQDQLILQKKQSGERKTQIAKQLGLNTYAVDRSLSRSTISLVRSLRCRLQAQDTSPGPVCGIFPMGKTSYMTHHLFNMATRYLVKNCSVSKFLVTEAYCNSSNVYSLGTFEKDVEITVITTTSKWTEPPPSPNAPPYQNVEILEDSPSGDPLYLTKAILKRSDLCLCDLSKTPGAPHIKAYLSQLDNVTVLDLGRIARTKIWNPAAWNP